jgi:hypothetical protein
MLNLQAKTKLPIEDVMVRAKRFFGEGGLGLSLAEETPGCVTFEGAGGYVTVSMCAEEGKTRVDLLTQEWDYQVKEFAAKLS